MAEEQRGERCGGITTDGKVQLCHYLANDDQVRQLLAVIGSYVSHSGLASTRHEVDDITSAIVSATIVRAFDIVETKYQGQGIHPWLLRIAHGMRNEMQARKQ
ncbi:hypothetical protein KDI_56290 [Dictyobacter arantiisoli]|uniref:Uncharacterized protein n=2 Tax=Dictyobacter arantiisoli TaxID=2014874 RepID=A0A5A5TL64_9CHLR|nr:hypothetical protein KDI_56290 [Dictyobacter arantiisoli]